MAAEQNLIKSTDLARVREVDFVERFSENVNDLIEMLGITRKEEKAAGTVLKVLKASGTLQDGSTVGEGETIPLSKYQTQEIDVGEITLKKWRKATSAEAIIDKGFDQAVTMTTDEMLKDVQKEVRSDFMTFLATGTGVATGANLQATLAQAWGQLQVKFDNDDIQAVYFINPLDIADYLASANISTQTAFGFTYVENFLGLGTVIMTSRVTKGSLFATAVDNIVLYYVPVNGADLGNVFDFTSDTTGYIGVHEESDYTNLTASDTVLSGLGLFAEKLDGIIVGTITSDADGGSGEPTYSYVKVTPQEGNNPSQKGWYELSGTEYVLTTDTTVDSEKTYYERVTA